MRRRGFLVLMTSFPFFPVISVVNNPISSEEIAKELSIPEWKPIEGDTILERYNRNSTIGGAYASGSTFSLVKPIVISKEN